MKRYQKNLLRIGAVTAAAALIIVGICLSEYGVVLQKAVVVCLECIGIG